MMKLLDRLVEYLSQINIKMRRWRRVISVMSAIVVFVTTYALILPAITLDMDTASAQSGIEMATENEAYAAGTVYESTEEKEPEAGPVEEEPEAESVAEEEPAVEEGSEAEPETEEEQAAEPEAEDESEEEEADLPEQEADNAEEESVSADQKDAPGDSDDAEDDESRKESAPAAETGSEAEETIETVVTEDTPLITEKTQLIYENKEKDYVVYADFDGSAKLPVGVELQVKEITKEDDPETYKAYYDKALEGLKDKYDENTGLSFARFYDIAFVFEGQEIEPQGNVNIKIEYKEAVEVAEETKVDAIHFDKEDEEKVDVIDTEINAEIRNSEDTQIETVDFESDKFSVYGVVGSQTFTEQYLTEDGETYNISVTAGAEAHIPADAHLEISEVDSDSDKYDELFAKAEEAVLDGRDASVPYARFFDIAIVGKDGGKIQPDAPVEVKITFDETVEADKNAVFNAVHITDDDDDNVEVIDVTTEGEESDDAVAVEAVQFSAEGFSYYAVVYTVEVQYTDEEGDIVDIGNFDILGGESVTLARILEEMDVETEDAYIEDAEIEGGDFVVLNKNAEDADEWTVEFEADNEEDHRGEKASLKITLDDETQYIVTMTVTGIEEVEAGNIAVIRAADGTFLPEKAEGRAKVVKTGSDAVASVKEAEKSEDAADETATQYEVFDISLENVDTDRYADGFKVEVSLPESVVGKDFRLYHIHDGETEEIELNTTGRSVGETGLEVVSGFEFTTSSFSEFVLSYTVDFTYEGKTWSFPGEGSYKLSEVLAELGIEGKIDNAELALVEGEDHEGALYLEKKGREYWITSDISFTDTYELKVETGGKVYIITVTDPPAHARPTTNLNDLVTNFNLTGATSNGDGTYTVKPGVSYGVDITFTESETTHQFDNHRELVYTLPAGVDIKGVNSPFAITINYLGNNVTIGGNTVEVRDGKLVVKLNDSDPNFRKFEAITTAQIKIHAQVEFNSSQSGHDIVIPGGGTYHVDGSKDVRISKSGRVVDYDNGKAEYTLNVTSVGSNSGVTITDELLGRAFTGYESGSIKLYDKNGNVVNNANASVNGKSFTLMTGPLEDGNYQVKYTANFNKGNLTEDGNFLGIASDTNNKVTWDGDNETTHDLGHIVEKKQSWKGAGSSTTNAQGIATTPWTIVAYTSPLDRLEVVSDTIKNAAETGTKYSGTGFDVKITDVITGQQVGTTQHVDWPSGTVSTWSYNFSQLPGFDNNGKYWKYEITYTTETNMSNAQQSAEIVNEGGPDDDQHEGHGTVNPPEANRTGIEKTLVSVNDNNEVTWRIKLTIPRLGVDSARSFVTEHLPSYGSYKDTYVDDSFAFVEGFAAAEGAPTITTLANGDVEFRWAQFNATNDQRTVIFTFKTKFDPDWIGDEDAPRLHQNHAEFNNDHSYAGANYDHPMFEKVGSSVIAEDGELYFDFDVKTNKITDGSFGEDGTTPLTFTDTYDSHLEFVAGSARLYGGDNENNINGTNNGALPTAQVADSGNTLTFTVNKSMLPTKYGQLPNGDWGETGELYPYYRLHYRMKVKNASALQSEALQLETLTVKMGNEIVSDIGNDETTVEYTPDVLDKWQSANLNADMENHKGKVQFTIHVNAAQLDLEDGDILTLYDKLENISTAYQDIEITFPKNNYHKGDVTTTIPETGQTVEIPYYNMKGDTVTFYLPDGVDTLITYWAKPTGEVGADGKIHYTNTAQLKGFVKKVEESSDWSGDASGLATQYGVNLYKADGYENSRMLAGAQFKLFMVDEEDEDGNIISGTPLQTYIDSSDPDAGTTDKIFTTTSTGTIRIEGDEQTDGWNLKPEQRYYLLEVKAPEGMAIDTTKYSFIISSKGYTNYTRNAIVAPDGSGAIVQPWTYYNGDVLTVKDWPKDGELEITKEFDQSGDVTAYNQMTAEQKSAITFEVYQKQDDQSWKLFNTVSFDQFTADEHGVPKFTVGDLKPGIYKVVEVIDTDTDTTCKEQTYQVTLDQDSVEDGEPKYVTINITEADIINHTQHGMTVTNKYEDESEFKIYKYANRGVEGRTEIRLAGAEFGVFATENGVATTTQIGSNYKTNGRGLFSVKPSTDSTGIQYDTLYALKEVKAPDGFKVSETIHYFYFVGNGNTAPATLPSGTTIIPFEHSVQSDIPNDIGTTSVGVRKIWQNNKLEVEENKDTPVDVKVIQVATLDKEGKNVAILGNDQQNPIVYPSDDFLFTATKSGDKWDLAKKVETAELPDGVTIENGRLTGLPAMTITNNGILLYYHYEIEEVVPSGYAASYSTDTEEDGSTTVTITNRPDTVQSFVKLQAEKKWFTADGQDITSSMGVDDGVEVVVYRKEGVVTDGKLIEADGTEKSAGDLFTLLTNVERSTQSPVIVDTASVIALPGDQIKIIFKPQNANNITATDFVAEVGRMDQHGNLNGSTTLSNPVIESGNVVYTYIADAAHNTVRVKVTQNRYVSANIEIVNASAKGRTQVLSQNDANAVGGNPVETLTLNKANGWKATSKEYSGGSGIVVYSYYIVEQNGENFDAEYVVDGNSVLVKNTDKRLRVDKKWFRPDGTTEMDQPDGSIVYNLYQVKNGREWKENQFTGDGPFSVSISEFVTGDPNNIGQNQPTIHFDGNTSGIRPGSKVKITITKDNPNNGNMDIQDTSWASAFTVTGGTATIGTPYTIKDDNNQDKYKVREILVEDVASSIKLSGYMNIQGGNVWISVEVLGEYDTIPVTDETQMKETRVGQITMTADDVSVVFDSAFAESGIRVKPDKGAWTSVISKLPERSATGDTYTYYITEESVSLDSFEKYGIDSNNVGNGHTVIIKNKAKPAKVRVTKAFEGIENLPSEFKITNSYNDTVFTVDNKAGGAGTEQDPYYWELDNLVIGQEISFYELNFGLDDKETIVYDNAGNVISSPYKVTTTAVEEITSSAPATGVTGYVNKYKNKPGALKFTKNVTFNGSGQNLTDEQKALIDGIYTFTVIGPESAPEAEKVTEYVRITVSGGAATSYLVADGDTEEDWEVAEGGDSAWATVTNLYEGVYTITETGKNGLTLTSIERSDNNTSVVDLAKSEVKVTVVANDTTVEASTAQATFTNDYTRIDVTKLWRNNTSVNMAWPEDVESITLNLKKKVGSGNEADYLTLTVPKPTGTQATTVSIAAATTGGTVPEGVTATVAQKTATASDGYVITIDRLPRTENGNTITYSFTENQVTNYQTSYAQTGGQTPSGGQTTPGTQTTLEELTAAPVGGTIINKPMDAVELPSTGGLGTSRFYGLGISFVAMAGLLLFIKRRSIRDLSEGRW